MKVTLAAHAKDHPWYKMTETVEGKDWQEIAIRLYAKMCTGVSIAAATDPQSGFCNMRAASEFHADMVDVVVVEDPPTDPLIAELEALAQ